MSLWSCTRVEHTLIRWPRGPGFVLNRKIPLRHWRIEVLEHLPCFPALLPISSPPPVAHFVQPAAISVPPQSSCLELLCLRPELLRLRPQSVTPILLCRSCRLERLPQLQDFPLRRFHGPCPIGPSLRPPIPAPFPLPIFPFPVISPRWLSRHHVPSVLLQPPPPLLHWARGFPRSYSWLHRSSWPSFRPDPLILSLRPARSDSYHHFATSHLG